MRDVLHDSAPSFITVQKCFDDFIKCGRANLKLTPILSNERVLLHQKSLTNMDIKDHGVRGSSLK